MVAWTNITRLAEVAAEGWGDAAWGSSSWGGTVGTTWEKTERDVSSWSAVSRPSVDAWTNIVRAS